MDVLLPFLDDALPLPPAVPPVLLWSSGITRLSLRLWNKTDVFVIGQGIFPVGNLFLSSENNRNESFKYSLRREIYCTSLK